MKIVYAASRPENVGGGETLVAFSMARRMAKDHEVIIVHPSPHDDTMIEKEGNLIKYGIRSVENNNIYTPKLDRGEINKFKRYLNRFDPDIAHGHSLMWLGQILQDWAIANKKPFFYTTHILPSKVAVWTDLDSMKAVVKMFTDSALFRNYIGSFYNSCSMIITLNTESNNDLKRFGYKGKSCIIPNGADLQTYRNLKPQNPNDEIINLFYIGNISKRKRQLFLVESMRYLPKNFVLNLVGSVDVDKTHDDKIRDYMRKYSLDNVKLLGEIPNEKIPSIVEQNHYFVSASTAEVQSLAVIEAMAGGKPCIAIENETTRELVDDKTGVLLDKDTTPSEFAEEILKLHSQKDRYEELAQACIDRISGFEFGTIVKRTEELYLEHIDSSAKRNSKASSRVIATGILAGTVAMYLGFKAINRAKRR